MKSIKTHVYVVIAVKIYAHIPLKQAKRFLNNWWVNAKEKNIIYAVLNIYKAIFANIR